MDKIELSLEKIVAFLELLTADEDDGSTKASESIYKPRYAE